MAILHPGVEYDLSSERSISENKDLVFVKLTDSAFRAIEEYLKIKSETREKPTIEFVGSEGRIKFPSKNLNRGNFNFTISGNQGNEGPQSGFECVQKTGENQLESLGSMMCRMQIKANDDVYETTRSRMQQVEVDNKNKCTRVLKANDSVNKKVRIKRDEPRKSSVSVVPTALTSKYEPRKSSVSVVPTALTSKYEPSRAASSSAGFAKQTSRAEVKRYEVKASHNSASNSKPKVREDSRRDEVVAKAPSNVSNSKLSSKVNVKKDVKVTKESKVSSSTSSSKASNTKSSDKNDGQSKSNGVKYRSLLERITQLLAVRSYTKFELKTRFTREGVLEKERNQLTSNLQTVAYLKENKYYLKKNWYSDVQEDWPFYTEEEKLKVRVNKTTNLVGDSSDSSCSGFTPRSTSSVSSPSSVAAVSLVQLGTKRKVEEDMIVDFPRKKQRVSNHHRSNFKSISEVRTKSYTSSDNGHEKSKRDGQESQSMSKSSSKEDISNSRGSTPESATTELSTLESSPDLNQLSLKDLDGPSETPVLPENTDYLVQYTRIKTYEQRAQYKADYHAYFPVYEKLYSQRIHDKKTFSDLEEKFYQMKSAGDEAGREEIEWKIYEEYIKVKDVTERYNNLYKRLLHIKQMIEDYDYRLSADL